METKRFTHENANGFSIAAKNANQLIEYANKQLNSKDFENCYLVDYILYATKDNEKLLYTLASHPEYFGNHIDEIKVVIKNISMQNIMAMGANKDSMKISYNGIDYVKFKDENFVTEIMNYRTTNLLTVYGRVNLNNFAGHTSIQIFIDDYELNEDESKYDF